MSAINTAHFPNHLLCIEAPFLSASGGRVVVSVV
jgi:hypothetical protein